MSFPKGGHFTHVSCDTLQSNGSIRSSTAPVRPDDLVNKDYVDSLSVPGGGDVVGPAGATDEAIARFDSATGKLIQDSAVSIDDFGNVSTTTVPTSADHLTNKDYVDTEVATKGDVSGPGSSVANRLVVYADATGKAIANSSGITALGDSLEGGSGAITFLGEAPVTGFPPTNANALTNKNYVDTQIAAIPGGGDVTGPASSIPNRLAVYADVSGKLLSSTSSTITSSGNALEGFGGAVIFTSQPPQCFSDPVGGNDIARKSYVDTQVSAVPVGDVVGPAGATFRAIPRFEDSTGKLIAETGTRIDDDDKVLAANTFQHVRVIRTVADLDPTVNFNNGNGANEDFYPIPAGTLFVIDTPGNTPLVLGNGFYFNADSGIRGVDLSTSSIQFDESGSGRDITGFRTLDHNVYISDLTIIGGGGHFSMTGITPGVGPPLGLFSCENYSSGAPAPFYGRNKRFRVQNNNILRPYRLGTVRGFGTLNINSNFINGGGAVGGGDRTVEGLHVTAGLSLEMLGNKMVLFDGAQNPLADGAMLTFDPNLNSAAGVPFGFNATLIESNIFHPRSNERGIVFDAESTTALGNVSGNTFIRTGGNYPLVDYPKYPLAAADAPQNYNVLPVLNYVFDSNTGIPDSRPHLGTAGGGIDFNAAAGNTGFASINAGVSADFSRLKYNPAAPGGVFADFRSSVHFVVRLSILWDLADPAVVVFNAGDTPTAGQRYQVAAVDPTCDLTVCAVSWVDNFQSAPYQAGGIFVATGTTIGGTGTCSLIPIPDDHTMVTFEDSLSTIYQSAYVYRYEPTGITDAEGPVTTYVWATNFTSLDFPRPNGTDTSVTWQARTMDGTVIDTYSGAATHTTVWGGAPIFRYIDPNPRLLQVVANVVYQHNTQNEEVRFTLGNHEDPVWADDRSRDAFLTKTINIPASGAGALSEQGLLQQQYTTTKNNAATSVCLSGTKRFDRDDTDARTLSIYGAGTAGIIDTNRIQFTAE